MLCLRHITRALCTGLILFSHVAFAQQNSKLSDYKMQDFAPQQQFNFATGNIDEAAIGRQLFRKIRQRQPLIEDPELTMWIQALVQRLARHAPNTGKLYVAIVNNPNVNAYALQGGIIIVNSGLILSAETESELAAVIAHEIAHVSQRHISRIIASRENSPWLTGLGIIAGAAVASKNPQAGQAIMAGATALNAQQQIAYSQSFESEADRAGLRILAGAGFNPAAMPHFLEKLERSEINLYGNITKYLRSHPLTIERLSDTRNRANRLRNTQVRESIDFLYAREKVRVLFDRNFTAVRRPLPGMIERYKQAMTASKNGQHQRVLQLLGKPSGQLPHNLLMAQTLNKLRRYVEAEKIMRPLLQRFPRNEAVTLELARAVHGKGQTAQAMQLLNRIPSSDHTSLEFLEAAQQMARQARQPQQAILFNAERRLRVGDYRNAGLSVQQTLRTQNLTPQLRSRLQRKLKVIQQAQQEFTYLKQR